MRSKSVSYFSLLTAVLLGAAIFLSCEFLGASEELPPPPVEITSQPQSTAVMVSGSAAFSVAASGENVTYQWRKNGVPIAGATEASYVLASADITDNGAAFDCVVTRDGETVTSAAAFLTVHQVTQAALVLTQPSDQTLDEGQTATFTITAGGDEPRAYQWRRNGAAIPGATLISYTTGPLTAADNSAQFDVIVSNGFGADTSDIAVLTVSVIVDPPLSDLRLFTDEISGWTEDAAAGYVTFDAQALYDIINGGATQYDNLGLSQGSVQSLNGGGFKQMTQAFVMDFLSQDKATTAYNDITQSKVSNAVAIPGFASDVATSSPFLGGLQVYFHNGKYYFEFSLGGYGADRDQAAADASLFIGLYLGRW